MEFAVQDLHIEFGPRVLFDKLSFVVERGERIAFAGQNGAGKSTLMKCIVGALEPDHGRILLPKYTRGLSAARGYPHLRAPAAG